MKQVYRLRPPVLAMVGIILCCRGILSAQDVNVYGIVGRIITVESEGAVVMVNRGSTVNVIPDSVCTVQTNRDTELTPERVIATATIMDVFTDSMRVALNRRSDKVMTDDLCELYAYIPTVVADSDIGRMAMYDIIFVDFSEEEPLYTLTELVRAPQPEEFDAIAQRFLNELYDQAEMGEYGEGRVQTGFYNGMTLPEAFACTDRYKLERFFRYITEEYRTYSGSDWIFVNVFRTWVLGGTPVTASDRER